MRQELAKRQGERATFRGVFARYGEKRGWEGRTERAVLLRDIRDAEGELVADHIWLNYTRAIESLGDLVEGDIVQFDARVTEYEKGYKGWRLDVYAPVETDYKLSRPTRVRKVEAET